MKAPTLQTTGPVPLSEIDTRDRLRPVSEAGVESIIASIEEVGVMKDPVHLRRKKNGQLVLIAGGHRVEAAKRLGWTEIEAKVWVDVTDDWSRMMEIDDNLAGAELTPLDTAIFLARRKEVYERLHPETKRGVAGAVARWDDATANIAVASFAKATAEKFSMSERKVFMLLAAGSRLSAKDAHLLRSAPNPVSLTDLGELSKVGNPAARHEVVEAFAAGTAKKIKDAVKACAAREGGMQPTLKDPVEEAFKALSALWARAPKAAKRRFVEEHADDLAQMIEGGADTE